MSVLIKGMKMPKNCDKCILSSSIAMRCDATKKSLVTDTYPKRPSWCPLVKISEPHGRLIDGAALKTKLNNIHDFLLGDCKFSDLSRSDKARIDELTNCIAEVVNAPTVIEIEEQEHE